MPIFEYECGKCGNIFEVIEGKCICSTKEDSNCSKCHSSETKRLLSMPNTVATIGFKTSSKSMSAAHYKDIKSLVYDPDLKMPVRRKSTDKIINGAIARS